MKIRNGKLIRRFVDVDSLDRDYYEAIDLLVNHLKSLSTTDKEKS